MIRLRRICSIWPRMTGACGRSCNFVSTLIWCLLRSLPVSTRTSSTRLAMSVRSRWVDWFRAKPSMLLMTLAARWLPLRILSRAWRRAASPVSARSPSLA